MITIIYSIIINIKIVIMNIALIGQTSVGKSSVAISCIGKRVAHTGLCPTTVVPTYYSMENIMSDDGIQINIIDFPGIASIDDTNSIDSNNINYLDMITYLKDQNKHIDLVIWVTDITKAFLTKHELIEYNKLKETINKYMLETGNGIQLIVMASKMEFDISMGLLFDNKIIDVGADGLIDKLNDKLNDKELQEIYGQEKTSHYDMYKNMTKVIKEDIICYNAHGRSYHNINSSTNLKEFVSKFKPNNVNIEFNMKKYYDGVEKTNGNAALSYIINELNMISTNHIIKIDELCNKISNIYESISVSSYNSNEIKIKILMALIDSNSRICYGIRLKSLPLYNYKLLIQHFTDVQLLNYLMLTNDINKTHDKLYICIKIKKNIVYDIYNIGFEKNNIYDLEDYYNERFCQFIKNDSNIMKKYKDVEASTHIYSKKYIVEVKRIRTLAFGINNESDIDDTMIPIAYEKHGLFWL